MLKLPWKRSKGLPCLKLRNTVLYRKVNTSPEDNLPRVCCTVPVYSPGTDCLMFFFCAERESSVPRPRLYVFRNQANQAGREKISLSAACVCFARRIYSVFLQGKITLFIFNFLGKKVFQNQLLDKVKPNVLEWIYF